MLGNDLCAEGLEASEEGVVHRGGDVHLGAVRVVDGDVGFESRHAGRRVLVAVLPHGIEQVRVELPLSLRARFLLAHERVDLRAGRRAEIVIGRRG